MKTIRTQAVGRLLIYLFGKEKVKNDCVIIVNTFEKLVIPIASQRCHVGNVVKLYYSQNELIFLRRTLHNCFLFFILTLTVCDETVRKVQFSRQLPRRPSAGLNFLVRFAQTLCFLHHFRLCFLVSVNQKKQKDILI